MRRVGSRRREERIFHGQEDRGAKVEPFVSRAGALAAALAIALSAVAVRAPFFDLPLERDEGEYAYIAWRLGAGETPYLDWFDQKPPAVFLAYRTALALPGDPVVAIRVVGALFCAGSALALFALVRGLLGSLTGLAAAVLLIFLSADPMLQGPVANTEIFMAPWIVAAALVSLRLLGAVRPRFATAFAVGVLLGIATAFKQVAVVNAPLLLAVYALRAPRGERVRGTVLVAAGIASGGLCVWGAIGLWFWMRGGLGAAVDAMLLHNLSYTSDLTLAERWGAIQYSIPALLPSQSVAWLLAGFGFLSLIRRSDRFPALFLGGFAVANAIGVSASGFYFPHYFQQILPAIAALAAAGIAGPAERPRTRLALGAAGGLAPLVAAWVAFARIGPAEASRRIYPDNNFEAMPVLAAEIASLSSPGDRVFLFGAEPEVLFYARRVSASRYIFLFPVFNRFADAKRRQAEVIAEVEAARPAVIVSMPLQSFFGRGRPQLLTRWVQSYVDSHYRLRAAMVAGDGRSELRRLPSGDDVSAFLAQSDPWAAVYVRATP